MFKLRSAEVVTITPERAAVLLGYNYVGQRRLAKRRLDLLQQALKDDTFRVGCIGVAVEKSGDFHLVNGQHQLTACINEQKNINALIETFEVEGDEDLSLLYRQYDSSISSRSARDCAKPEFDALGVEWPKAVRDSMLSAINIILNQGGKKSSQRTLPNERISRIKDFVNEGDWISYIHSGNPEKSSKILMRGPVVASMIETLWASSPVLATSFWEPVREGAFLSATSPMYHLREFLAVARMGSTKRSVGSHEIMFRCIAEWNRFAEGEKKCLRRIAYSPDRIVPEAKTPRTLKAVKQQVESAMSIFAGKASRLSAGEPA